MKTNHILRKMIGCLVSRRRSLGMVDRCCLSDIFESVRQTARAVCKLYSVSNFFATFDHNRPRSAVERSNFSIS